MNHNKQVASFLQSFAFLRPLPEQVTTELVRIQTQFLQDMSSGLKESNTTTEKLLTNPRAYGLEDTHLEAIFTFRLNHFALYRKENPYTAGDSAYNYPSWLSPLQRAHFESLNSSITKIKDLLPQTDEVDFSPPQDAAVELISTFVLQVLDKNKELNRNPTQSGYQSVASDIKDLAINLKKELEKKVNAKDKLKYMSDINNIIEKMDLCIKSIAKKKENSSICEIL